MIPGSANPLLLKSAAAAAGYQIERSLRFNSSDSGYLSRTPASAGNRRTWTWAGWVKRSGLGSGLICLADARTGANESPIMFNESVQDTLSFYQYIGGFNWQLRTTQVFRDVGAWFHLVVAVDTTQATAANRIKIYLNGSEITTFAIASYPSQNSDTSYNSTNIHTIGAKTFINSYFDGYLADVHFIDGQALTPSSFTEVSATTGQLVPKAYTGTFGTNGFWLKFSDNSNNTAATLGKDYSGNSNNWTPNNLSVTAGAGNDSLVDTPTSYGTDTSGVGGVVRGNYATLNPLQLSNSNRITLSNGNLQGAGNSVYYGSAISTIAVNSGKWYAEFTFTLASTIPVAGIIKTNPLDSAYQNTDDQLLGRTANGYGYRSNQQLYNNNSISTYGASWTDGNAIGVALDLDAGTLTFYKNGVSQGQAASGLSGYYAIGCSVYSSAVCDANFGQRAFAYTAPSGFKALCDTNLGAPLVAKPNTVMDVLVFAATNANNTSITGLNFQPDLVWGKSRTNAYSHQLYDSVRGVNKNLKSNTTGAEVTDTVGLTSFDSNGFTAGVDFNVILGSGSSVAWCWDAGSSTVTNTQGSITSQVRANASAGFSVVTYTGNATAGATVGHGLGVAPALIINKQRSGTNNWWTYHASLGATKYLVLDATNAVATANTVWNDTAPTSTVFSIGVTGVTNTNSATYVTYCFAPVTGYSNGFSYTGNGSTDGVFQYLGFRPRLIMLKRSDSTSNWTLLDTSREGYNVDNDPLYPNLSDAEGTTDLLDITSNGFKLRSTDASVNASAGTYIGFAWAENPFQYARAR